MHSKHTLSHKDEGKLGAGQGEPALCQRSAQHGKGREEGMDMTACQLTQLLRYSYHRLCTCPKCNKIGRLSIGKTRKPKHGLVYVYHKATGKTCRIRDIDLHALSKNATYRDNIDDIIRPLTSAWISQAERHLLQSIEHPALNKRSRTETDPEDYLGEGEWP